MAQGTGLTCALSAGFVPFACFRILPAGRLATRIVGSIAAINRFAWAPDIFRRRLLKQDLDPAARPARSGHSSGCGGYHNPDRFCLPGALPLCGLTRSAFFGTPYFAPGGPRRPGGTAPGKPGGHAPRLEPSAVR